MADDDTDDDVDEGGLSPEEVLLAVIRKSRAEAAADRLTGDDDEPPLDIEIPEPELPASVLIDAPSEATIKPDAAPRPAVPGEPDPVQPAPMAGYELPGAAGSGPVQAAVQTEQRKPMIDRPAVRETPAQLATDVERENPFVYVAPVVPRGDPGGTGFEFSFRPKSGGRG